MKYGCHDRADYKPYHLPTGADNLRKYRIAHVMTKDCQYTLTDLGKVDPKCDNCTHKKESGK